MRRFVAPVLLLVATWLAAGVAAAPRKVPENPATITVEVAPEVVAPGAQAAVTVKLEPIDGIKIARYPQIKLRVPAHEGLVAEASTAIGNTAPPPADMLHTNYWKTVDPVVLTLTLDEAAAPGRHEIAGKLIYFFCISGDFCAPARVPIKIPVGVE